MKKILTTAIALGFITLAATAQTSAPQTAPQMTKEEKAKMKAQQDADLTASFKDAGLTDDQTAKARVILDDANKQSNELKKNSTLTDAEKEDKKKGINDEKNTKLKEVMGDKYKAWTAIRKKQKESMMAGQVK